ncbi:MAG: chromosome segregation protein SMC [Lachnospiraceae bacterium]|nr:chromosome segregation protein SMC [Lachnospiraceae bacterium]
MRLKLLEIQGFKSFPDKIQLRFGDDITAIVGPNGSGKSNISDAIRWVMGEQSTKALRGNKMEDVIFGGTLKRPQLGFAEASLVFDNADRFFPVEADEMMVTRRYYRSGENEFYLNKQSVRLKDVNELFMDTGLGREGYSNISQGRIDEILSVKSTDRREVFEEAAGISKYRHRKEETERRLERTEENLLRIEDKISELELQVEPLRVQSEQAKKYLEIQKELKGQEVALCLHTLSKLDSVAQKAETDYVSSKFVLDQEHSNLEELYRKSDELNRILHEQDAEIEKLRVSADHAEEERQKLSAQISVLDSERKNAEENAKQLSLELDDQHKRTGGLYQQLSAQRERLLQIDSDTAKTQDEVSELQAKLNEITQSAEGLSRRYLELRNLLGNVTAEEAAKRADLAAIKSAEEQNRARLTELISDRDLAVGRRMDAEQKLNTCKSALETARDEAQRCRNVINGYQLRRKARADRVDDLSSQVNRLSVELNTAVSKRNLLLEMERDYEGFTKAVRFVMQQKEVGALQNIHGPISRLFRTEDRYTVAIEIALGGAMQDIVVSTEQDAKRAIQLLKNRDAGRATFLPVSAIHGKRLSESGLERSAGFVGIASELVACKEEYRQIIENLLGRTVITERLDDAIEMSRKYRSAFRIVTLDGQVMNPGGSMTGGSSSRNAGVLSRANEIERLGKQCETLKSKKDDLSKSLSEAVRQMNEAEFELEASQGSLREQEDRILRLEGEEKQFSVLVEAIQQAAVGNQKEIDFLEAKLTGDENRAEVLRKECDALSARQTELQNDMDALSGNQSEVSNQGSEIMDLLTSLRMRIASYETEKQTVHDSILHLKSLAADLEGDRGRKQLRIEEIESHISELIKQIDASRTKFDLQTNHTESIRESVKQSLALRAQTEAERTAAEHASQQKNKDILDLERETARLEAKKNSAELEQKQILDKLWDNYGLTPSTAPKEAAEIESVAASNRRVSELRRKLQALGTPNLGAIDEYARVSERYTYLTGQRDDVQQSKKDLESIIRDITRQMTGIFTEEFTKINHYFGETFVEMFHGGKASVELEDPDDPLNCGIEIKVQPPGKQLKTITLLSGGEKAFVAIALYFSILKVRPTPFCMLDEIDAALDERNVQRFSEYLHLLCRKTQFIVITHRRGTMEAADALFGVTMQEQGVSKILQLDMSKLERELGITN